MLDAEKLTAGEGTPEGEPRPNGPEHSGHADPSVLPGDLAPARATVYWILGVALALGSIVIPGGIASGAPVVRHMIVESIAVTLALVLGALALVRFYTRREQTYLFIGTGFLATALLDAFHAVVSSAWWVTNVLTADTDLQAWSWFQGRLFLSIFLFLGVLVWGLEEKMGRTTPTREASVYLTAITLSLVIMLVFGLGSFLPGFDLPAAVHPDLLLPRPAELLPGLFFGLAFIGYYHKGAWRHDQFEHWLLISLLIAAIGQIGYMSRSIESQDLFFTGAHVLKLFSYIAVTLGVIIAVYVTSRREHAALQAIQGMNLTLAREVSVRREAESVLQRSEERLQNFLETAHDLIQSTSPDGRILYVNRAWEQRLGYGRSDLRDLRLGDILHPSSLKTATSAFERVLDGQTVPRSDLQFMTRQGDVVTCSGSLTRHVVDGRAVAVQAIFRDVTEQRAAEGSLAESKANLAAVIESTGDAIWSIDRDARLVTCNPAFSLYVEARTGAEPRAGCLPAELFPADEAEWYGALYTRVLAGERFTELHEQHMGTETRVFEVTGNPVAGEGGLTGGVMFGKDVTRRVRAEEALRMAKDEAEAANRAKSEFLANMSHELRTPLNSVIGFANIMLKNKAENLVEKDLGFLERIMSNGRHLLSLINEVLDLAKVEAGRMELDIESCDMGELVRETVAQLEGQASEKNVKLLANVPAGEIGTVETDPPKLKQVIINLVGNALKFSEGGTVTIRLETEGTRVVGVAVQDDGIGIPEDRLEAIFEAFSQADGSTSRKYGGTGLGLTISRSICQMLGYDLEVESKIGQGSTFMIRMSGGERPERTEGRSRPAPREAVDSTDSPDVTAQRARAAEAPAVAESEVERSLRGAREKVTEALAGLENQMERTVLVIDDESDSRVLLAHYLADFGCRVETASSALEGIARARVLKPDLITLDLMMPEMTGWEALQLLKKDPELRQIPVVIVSIIASEGRGRLLGAVDLLTKPVEREDLLRVLWRNLVRKTGGRILLIEDDEDNRALVQQYLESAGLEVEAVTNGAEGLEAVERSMPDAVLLDLMMPVMDGMTFLDKLRINPYHIGLPVIVLTAKELTREEREFLAEKASAVIPKGDEVEAQLREALGTILPLDMEDHEE